MSRVSGSISTEPLVASVRHSTRPSPRGSTEMLALSVSKVPLPRPTTLRTRSSRLPGCMQGHSWESFRWRGRPCAMAAMYARPTRPDDECRWRILAGRRCAQVWRTRRICGGTSARRRPKDLARSLGTCHSVKAQLQDMWCYKMFCWKVGRTSQVGRCPSTAISPSHRSCRTLLHAGCFVQHSPATFTQLTCLRLSFPKLILRKVWLERELDNKNDLGAARSVEG